MIGERLGGPSPSARLGMTIWGGGVVRRKYATFQQRKQRLRCIRRRDHMGKIAAGREAEADRGAVCFDFARRRHIGWARPRASLQSGVERELDPFLAARAFREAFGARADDHGPQLQEPGIAFADAEIGKRRASRAGRGRGQDRQGAVERMLRPAAFPERENFLGGESLHRLFHDRRCR